MRLAYDAMQRFWDVVHLICGRPQPARLHGAASYGKGQWTGDVAEQPLPAELVAALRPVLATKLPAAAVFAMPPGDTLAEIFKADLAAARAAWLSGSATPEQRAERERSDFLSDRRHNGLVLVFHSLRHSYIANGKRAGIPLATMMQLARHSAPQLTARRYGSLTLHDLAGSGRGKVPEKTVGREKTAQTLVGQ